MEAERQLIVFARAPVEGRVKTRLARDIGQAAAVAFYAQSLESVLALSRCDSWQCEVQVADQPDAEHPAFQNVNAHVQHGSTLGQRMHHALAAMPSHDRVLIGSDIPGIRSRHIDSAFAALQRADYVFGPATDGGFWLVGCRRGVQPSSSVMANVRWSSEHALKDTLASLPAEASVTEIDTLTDVDDAASYHATRHLMPR